MLEYQFFLAQLMPQQESLTYAYSQMVWATWPWRSQGWGGSSWRPSSVSLDVVVILTTPGSDLHSAHLVLVGNMGQLLVDAQLLTGGKDHRWNMAETDIQR